MNKQLANSTLKKMKNIKTCENCIFGNKNIWELSEFERICTNGSSSSFNTIKKKTDTCQKHCMKKSNKDIPFGNAWIDTDGNIYKCEGHEADAEDLLNKICKASSLWPDDELEKRGWIKVGFNPMWQIRKDTGYWDNKELTQKQLDILWDWCLYNDFTYPIKERI